MRLAISNIAWKPEDDDAVAEVMRTCGADAVELAPTAYWPDPLEVPSAERRRLRAAWARRGFPVAALQSLLFGFPELNLFDPATRPAMLARLIGMLDVGADLGAGPLVLGSPRNRRRASLPSDEALEIATPFFRALGQAAEARGVCLCIEPNPPEYGCDFVTTAAEGHALVERVGSPGFGLHLDAAGMMLAGDDPVHELEQRAGSIRHCHLSAPHLTPVGPAAPPSPGDVIGALVRGGYAGVLSIEMRSLPDRPSRLEAVRVALRSARAALA